MAGRSWFPAAFFHRKWPVFSDVTIYYFGFYLCPQGEEIFQSDLRSLSISSISLIVEKFGRKQQQQRLWRKDRLCEQRRKKKTEESWKKVCHHRSHSECQWCVTWVKFRGRENIVRRNKNLTGPIHLCILKCVRVFQQQLWQLYSLPFWFSAIRLTSQP